MFDILERRDCAYGQLLDVAHYAKAVAPSRNLPTSRIGGMPKSRLYSRLKWAAFSYPTR